MKLMIKHDQNSGEMVLEVLLAQATLNFYVFNLFEVIIQNSSINHEHSCMGCWGKLTYL